MHKLLHILFTGFALYTFCYVTRSNVQNTGIKYNVHANNKIIYFLLDMWQKTQAGGHESLSTFSLLSRKRIAFQYEST